MSKNNTTIRKIYDPTDDHSIVKINEDGYTLPYLQMLRLYTPFIDENGDKIVYRLTGLIAIEEDSASNLRVKVNVCKVGDILCSGTEASLMLNKDMVVEIPPDYDIQLATSYTIGTIAVDPNGDTVVILRVAVTSMGSLVYEAKKVDKEISIDKINALGLLLGIGDSSKVTYEHKDLTPKKDMDGSVIVFPTGRTVN